MLKLLDKRLAQKTGSIEVTINPDQNMEDGELVKVIRELKSPRSLPHKDKIEKIYNGVEEAKP